MYSCPNCGGNVKFDIKSQRLKCFSCDSGFDMNAYSDGKKTDYYETKILTCPQCGGELQGDDTEAAVFCSFCGASNVLTQRMTKEVCPEHIIPFKVSKDECIGYYKKFLRKAIYAPASFKKNIKPESYRGIYMPYWYYTVKKNEKVEFKGGRFYQNGDYEYHDVYRLSAKLDAEFNGRIHDASSNFADYLSERISPFDESGMVEFNPAYLSGFYADVLDVEKDTYVEESVREACDKTKDVILDNSLFRKKAIRQNDNEYKFKGLYSNKDCIGHREMFPVWFMSYRYKDRMFYSVVNGQTGKAYGDFPMDPVKFFAFTGILALIIWIGFMYTGFIVPSVCLFTVCSLLYIITHLYSDSVKKIIEKEYKQEDKGVLNKEISYNSGAFAAMDAYEQEIKSHKKKEKLKTKGVGTFLRSLLILGVMVVLVTSALVPSFFVPESVDKTAGVLVAVLAVANMVCAVPTISSLINYEKKTSIGLIIEQLVMVIAAICLLISPHNDIIYYILSMVGVVSALVCVVDMTRFHNILCSNPLPQFERKGGDDIA